MPLLEQGWQEYRRCLPTDAGRVQVEETRRAFYAGAIHLFASMIAMLDPGVEPTTADLAKMDRLYAEITRYGDTLPHTVATKPRKKLR